MLQYLSQPPLRYSVVEQCQMVIEGGCAWIQLHLPGVEDSEIRELAGELIPLCRETSTILMLEDHPELTKELGLHGMHIGPRAGYDPISLREEFGPEAIIGVTVETYEEVARLAKADIDYVTLPSAMNEERIRTLLRKIREDNLSIPVVAQGDFTIETGCRTVALGVSGLCTGHHIADSKDPVEYTERFINAMQKLKLD